MILFQAQIEEHQTLAEHYRELAAKREALAAGLLVVQEQADSDLSSLRLLVDKCKEVAPDAIAQLKSAVLQFFTDGGNNGGDGGNQPTDPTPSPNGDEGQAAIGSEQVAEHILADLSTASTDGDEGQVEIASEQVDEEGLTESVTCDQGQAAIASEQLDEDEPELLCLNGVTGEALTTEDLDEGVADAVPCAICGADLNDEANYPEFTAAALAGICRSCEAEAVEAEEAAQTEDDADNEIETSGKLTYAQAIKNRCSACWGYEVRSKGDIKSGFVNRTDLNFMEAVNLERSGREFYETVETYLDRLYYNGSACDIDSAPLASQACEWASPFASPFACPIEPVPQPLPSNTEMVHTSARSGYLKLKANEQILAAYAWFPRKDLAEAWFDFLDGMSLGSPQLRLSKRNSSWKYEIKLTGLSMTQIERLSQEDLGRKPFKKKETPAQAAGIEAPAGWRQLQLPEAQVTACAPKKARITLESSPYCGHVCDVVEANNNWWTLATPKGNLKYPADSVESVDEAAQMAGSEQETEAIAFEFGDIAQVVADLNDTHLVGSFGKVKFVKDGRVALEIDEQVVLFQPNELSLKAKAEIPQQQQQQSGQILLGNRIVTNGNYVGAARRTAIANARRGTANKIAALELVKAGLSPELAMAAVTGTSDDASDF